MKSNSHLRQASCKIDENVTHVQIVSALFHIFCVLYNNCKIIGACKLFWQYSMHFRRSNSFSYLVELVRGSSKCHAGAFGTLIAFRNHCKGRTTCHPRHVPKACRDGIRFCYHVLEEVAAYPAIRIPGTMLVIEWLYKRIEYMDQLLQSSSCGNCDAEQ